MKLTVAIHGRLLHNAAHNLRAETGARLARSRASPRSSRRPARRVTGRTVRFMRLLHGSLHSEVYWKYLRLRALFYWTP